MVRVQDLTALRAALGTIITRLPAGSDARKACNDAYAALRKAEEAIIVARLTVAGAADTSTIATMRASAETAVATARYRPSQKIGRQSFD